MAAISFALSLGSACAQSNLLRNGDLSAGAVGQTPPGWTFSTWNLPKDQAEASQITFNLADVGGENALSIHNKLAAQTFVWWQQEVPCNGGSTYVLRVRTKGSKGELIAKGYAGISAGLFFFDGEHKWLGYEKMIVAEFTEDWESHEAEITLPDNAVTLGVRLALQSNMEAEAYFSKIELNEK